MSEPISDGPQTGNLDNVRRGLRMAAPLDPQQLAAEKELLRELEHAPESSTGALPRRSGDAG